MYARIIANYFLLRGFSSSSGTKKIARKIRPAKIGITIVKAPTERFITITVSMIRAIMKATVK